ncbi:MAG: glycosyl hydrolase 53 family protein [Bacteroidota bacterium]
MKRLLLSFLILICLNGCSDDEPNIAPRSSRVFDMGFTTWSYGPTLENVNETYSFIANNSHIYSEHIDSNIPWNAWINDETLPVAFTNEIAGRVDRKILSKERLLSVSLLNLDRDDLASDFDGTVPNYDSFDDESIRNAYFKHINFLVGEINPEYLVIAMEVNELRLKSPEKWEGYKNLIADVKSRIKALYPELKISESVTLHNLYQPDVANPQLYIDEIMGHVNQNDFVAISFYPFFKNLRSKSDIQTALDFLHTNATKKVAFVETAQLAQNLEIPNLNVSIDGSAASQTDYLEVLIENANNQAYEFIIWWAHRDYDALWETFPDELKDVGQIWRDTGLLDENGTERPAFTVWSESFLQ